MNLMGKRFLFGIVAMVCVSVVSWHLKYDAGVYVSLVSSIVGMFMVSQSITDIKNGGQK